MPSVAIRPALLPQKCLSGRVRLVFDIQGISVAVRLVFLTQQRPYVTVRLVFFIYHLAAVRPVFSIQLLSVTAHEQSSALCSSDDKFCLQQFVCRNPIRVSPTRSSYSSPFCSFPASFPPTQGLSGTCLLYTSDAADD